MQVVGKTRAPEDVLFSEGVMKKVIYKLLLRDQKLRLLYLHRSMRMFY